MDKYLIHNKTKYTEFFSYLILYFLTYDEIKKREIDNHVVRKSKICSLNKHTSKELYLILVGENTVKSTAQDYFENLLQLSNFN